MESLPTHSFYKFNPDTLEAVRKTFDLEKPSRMKESIDLLEDWVMKQDHFLKKDFSRDYLERMLITAKGSVQRAKERLDRLCTFKTLMPRFFEISDVRDLDHYDSVKIIALPKLSKDHVRTFVAINAKNYKKSTFLDAYRFFIMMMEYTKAWDYAQAYEIILDYRDAQMADLLSKFDILDMKDLTNMLIDGYGVRVKGIHLIADSTFIDILLALAKQVVPSKLAKRIHVHKNLDTLLEMVDKDVLPEEFGGKEKTVKEIHDDCFNTLDSKEFKSYWKEMTEAKTDESKRSADVFNDQYMGMPGAFRNLSFD